MTEASAPMSRVERVAAFLLVSVLAALVLNREPRSMLGQEPWTKFAGRLGCDRVETCVAREAFLIKHLRERVLAADRSGIESTERALADVRDALARFAPEDDVDLDGELDSHGMRANAMEALASAYEQLSPEARAAIAPSR